MLQLLASIAEKSWGTLHHERHTLQSLEVHDHDWNGDDGWEMTVGSMTKSAYLRDSGRDCICMDADKGADLDEKQSGIGV